MHNNGIKKYEVFLKSDISKSFFCTKAAQSLDIDQDKKSTHHLIVEADLSGDFNVGLIFGSSGSGKTTLGKKIFGENIFQAILDDDKPIIDQFSDKYSYDERAAMLAGIGLTSVITWIRPAKTLSNGQRARAESALLMSSEKEIVCIDEWTSVVDRTVAKAMSHCVQKFARKFNKKIILFSCHYDVLEWLDPDFVIDCNKQEYLDRRSLSCKDRERKERLFFEIRPVDKKTWQQFSKYHYLSDKIPGGKIECFGLFHNDQQIGFQCFANYVPHTDKAKKMILHSNRTVIHPDYAGLGMGIELINKTSKIMHDKGYKIMATFSSTPVFKAMSRQDCWVLKDIKRPLKEHGGGSSNKNFMRKMVKMYSFEYLDSKAMN